MQTRFRSVEHLLTLYRVKLFCYVFIFLKIQHEKNIQNLYILINIYNKCEIQNFF
jgi:hypothetical protein